MSDSYLDHILDVTEDEWALEHPQRCRDAGSLRECATHQRVIEDARLYALPEPGVYRVRAHKLRLEQAPLEEADDA